jgi:aspartate/methionine/tyrosine aminotransferase
VILLNFPTNPTGACATRADLEGIAQLAIRHDLIVLTDEIYSELRYDDETHVSIAALPGMQERTVISDGCSKTWAMTGWRLGFVANRKLAPYFTTWITNTESCASQISQWAAVEALNGPQADAQRMRDIFFERRNLIVKLLNEVPGVTCQSPGGAFYVWPNVTEACALIGAKDSEELRTRLLNEAGVAVLADIHFGPRVPNEGQHIRFSYAASTEAIQKGIERMAEFIRRNTVRAKAATA